MTKSLTYLDCNATCPVLPEACVAMQEALALGGNASSIHSAGRMARARIEAARAQVASLMGASHARTVFTSGASEANLLALRGLPSKRIFTSSIEHDSVLNAAEGSLSLPVTKEGYLDLDHLSATLEEGDLVSVMAVNNETGIVQPLKEISHTVKLKGAKLHVDAVQAVGRIGIDYDSLGLSALSLSAHKFGGPPGIGALIFDPSLPLKAQTRGGGQERGHRGGTENMPGIAGFAAAIQWIREKGSADADRLAALRNHMEERLLATVPDLDIIGISSVRVGNTSCLALPDVSAEKQVIALDLAGFAVSAGSACSSGKVKASHVLRAMGLEDRIAGCAIRVSLSWRTSETEMDRFIAAYQAMAERLMP